MNPPDPNAFVTTRWTHVLAARGSSESARVALGELCGTYYRPVLAFLRRTGTGIEEPEDVAHAFFAGVLAGGGLDGAERGRGRFRSYLLGALKHFVANRHRRAARHRHGGTSEHVPLDLGDGTGETVLPDPTTPELDALFDQEWAFTVVEDALARLEREAEQSGTAAQFAVLKAWLSFGEDPGSQADAARTLGTNEGAVKVAVHRLRRRFRELVRATVRETLPDDASAEEELQHLIAALSGG
jgi:RNA polymerase sigma-70 factor (ECF subfamily)